MLTATVANRLHIGQVLKSIILLIKKIIKVIQKQSELQVVRRIIVKSYYLVPTVGLVD